MLRLNKNNTKESQLKIKFVAFAKHHGRPESQMWFL